MRLRRGVRLGRPFGIPLVVHASWLPAAVLLILHFTLTVYGRLPRPTGLVLGVLSALLFFASLVAHELGHALVARSMGIPVVDITLFIFGGVARIGREPSRPRQEILIASAGPFVSFVLGAAALATAGGGAVGELVRTIGYSNIALGSFNLLPGFPLDGGRILRAVLWARSGDEHRAAMWAGRSGQAIGALLACLGAVVFFRLDGAAEGLWLVVVGAFLSTLATAARRGARLAARLGVELAGAWARPFAGTLAPDALVHALPDGGPYAVEREGRLAGVLTHGVMVPWTSRLAFPAAESVRRALEHLQTEKAGVLVIVDEGGAAIGVLDHAGVRARLHPQAR